MIFWNIVFVLVVFYSLVSVKALECGIKERLLNEGVQSAITNCMVKVHFESSDSSTQHENVTRNEEGDIHFTDVHINSTPHTLMRKESYAVDDMENKNSTKPVSQKCILKCIMSEMGIVDEEEYPEHSKVAELLLKNANNRELRDFLQDTTDECFQLLEQDAKSDSCEYSTNLVTCMAEKGRSNCADWHLTNLTISS